jgi:Tfp pilus assembly protein PilF
MTHVSQFLLAATALGLVIPATGADAQRLPVGGSKTNKEAPKDAKPQSEADKAAAQGATTTTGRKVTVSREAQKAIVEYQNAVNANDTARLPALLAAAQAVAKTPDDKFIIASNQTKAALAAGDLAAIKAGIAALEASGVAESPDLAKRYADLGNRFNKAGQPGPAAEALQKAIALDPNNPAALTLLADLRSKAGNKAEAVSLMAKSFAASKARGEKVAEGNYRFAARAAYDLRSPMANDIAREWVAAYPSTTSWENALRIYRDLNRPTGMQLVPVMRLLHAAGALGGQSDYFAYLSALNTAGRLAEAKAVLADAAKDPDVNVNGPALKPIAAAAAKAPARAAIDAKAKAALAGGTAAALMAAGDDLYAVGAYAEAAAAYRAAAAKGGDTSLANLNLGIALARAGDKAGAEAALTAVTGANAQLAKYWLLWLATRA